MRRIVLCADDFALGPATSAGIAGLAQAGRLGAIGVMTAGAGAGAPNTWPMLDGLPDGVAIGLHLNFVDGAALSDGTPLPSAAWLLARALGGRLEAVWLEREIAAQWGEFERRGGAPPDFLDTHRHVHVLAPVREALIAAAQRKGSRVPIRNLFPMFGPAASGPKRLALRLLDAPALEQRLRAEGLAANRALGGLQAFGRPESVERDWRAMLAAAPDGAPIACHPACGPRDNDPIGAFSRAEHAGLASDAFVEACREAGVRTVGLRALAADDAPG